MKIFFQYCILFLFIGILCLPKHGMFCQDTPLSSKHSIGHVSCCIEKNSSCCAEKAGSNKDAKKACHEGKCDHSACHCSNLFGTSAVLIEGLTEQVLEIELQDQKFPILSSSIYSGYHLIWSPPKIA